MALSKYDMNKVHEALDHLEAARELVNQMKLVRTGGIVDSIKKAMHDIQDELSLVVMEQARQEWKERPTPESPRACLETK